MRYAFVFLALLLVQCTHPGGKPDTTPLRQGAPTTFSTLILDQVAEQVRSTDKKNRPVVVFDLDDTLFDGRTRTLSILHEFAANPEIAAEYPEQAEKLAKASLSDMRYDAKDAFDQLDVHEEPLLGKWKAFWNPRFFSDRYCERDDTTPGAASYVKRLIALGAHVVYLTGRDIGRMQKGTLASLKKRDLPTGRQTTLILKPKATDDDLAFKQTAFASIAKKGQVVAVFENEPKNLNAMSEAFPKAVLVFLDTQHSKAPDAVTPEAHWVKNFLSLPMVEQ
jgi:hypothetical protein